LRQLANKVIVIDTSIYLYKFAEKGAVAENMYLLISVFRQHNITPVFVFDGKPPAEKKALLIKRKIEKDAAEEKYNELKTAVEEGRTTNAALSEMESLKKLFVRVTDADIVKSKELMNAYGVPFIESRGESDHLCAFLVKHGFAWACLSDDMDMFLYGCPRVIRHLSLLNHEGIYYDTAQILTDLDMTQEVFNDIAILSGTDYNVNEQKSLSDTLRHYMEYREWRHFNGIKENRQSDAGAFYDWLMKTTAYIKDVTQLLHIRQMFDLTFLDKK
jgi:5'-3' exonuclease